MDLPASNYLLAVAAIAITFVSVSTVAFIFRQALGPGLSEVENQLIRAFIRTGLGATMFALLPPLLGLLGVEASLIWRLSSLLFALVELNALVRFVRTRALYQGLVPALSSIPSGSVRPRTPAGMRLPSPGSWRRSCSASYLLCASS